MQLLAQEAVDAVLLDLRMPGLDGLEVLARIRALPEPPAVTVLTAFASAGNTIEAMRLGAFDHVTKPIGRDDVADLVRRMLRAASGGGQGDCTTWAWSSASQPSASTGAGRRDRATRPDRLTSCLPTPPAWPPALPIF